MGKNQDTEVLYCESGVPFEELLRGLCENYESIYYVDFVQDKIYPYRVKTVDEAAIEDFNRKGFNFKTAFEHYIENAVLEEDQKEMTYICSQEFLEKRLAGKSAYAHEYRVKIDGKVRYFRVKFCNLDDDGRLRRMAVAFSDVSEDKAMENDLLGYGGSILVVDDDAIQRNLLASILGDDYNIILAADGDQAYYILDQKGRDIGMVITDLMMPGCDGIGLLSRIRSQKKFKNIPVIVSTGAQEQEDELKCLRLGAADFIKKPFIPEVVKYRVGNVSKLRESIALLHVLEKDPVTGLLSKDFFFRRAKEIMDANSEKEYRIVVTDVEKFKLVNEKYGIKMGDQVLQHIAKRFSDLIPNYVLGGRISGDKFVWLQEKVVQTREEGLKLLEEVLEGAPVPNLVMKHGIFYVNQNRKLTVQAMYDRARLAMESIKNVYGVYCAVYDDKIRQDLMTQKQVLDNMEKGLEEGQFQVYYQPKHNIRTNSTGGAEALVRWIHPELGFMNPGVFIPLFEQNGFIREMDAYVFRAVCRDFVQWKAEGKRVVPISINLSRRDFDKEDLAEKIIDIVDGYGIEHELIHFELTESAFVENPEQIARTIGKLHDNGFVIELDDFGTGYSSLTTLNSIKLDVIKLDISLIRDDGSENKNNVLEFVMQLSRMMKMQTVQEGVETEEQVERVKNLGCDYIQGYYYSKPLDKLAFEAYLANEG